MSYVLKRPMFRLGGQSADGVGITSGFRSGYAQGQPPRWRPGSHHPDLMPEEELQRKY